MASSRQQPGAVNRPFNTAYSLTALPRERATQLARPLRGKGQGPRQLLRSGPSVSFLSRHAHQHVILRSRHDHHTRINRTPYGRVQRRYKCPLIVTRPRPLASVARPGLRPGRCGLHGRPVRDARRLRRARHRSNGGARPVPPQEPLPTGAPLPVSVPACRWTVISNASRDPAGEKCVAKCATHFSLIGGQYRSLPREKEK